MNHQFDLNINNYSIKELEDVFNLPDKYDDSIVEMQETRLRQNLLNNGKVDAITKNNTLNFIQQIKTILTKNSQKISNSEANEISKFTKSFESIYNLDTSLQKSEIVNAGSTNIIEQKTPAYSLSYPSEFYPGKLNPLNKRLIRTNVNIDTRFRDSYYTTSASNFFIDIPFQLSDIVSMQLSALELPNTFYVVSKVFGNNFMVLEIKDSPNLVITIPDGNYDYLSLQNYINNFLDSQVGEYAEYANIQFLADINTPQGTGAGSGSGRMVIGSKNGLQEFSINFLTDIYGVEDRGTPLPLKFGWLLGFREGYYENNTTYVSEGIINLVGPRYLYLVIDDFNTSVNDNFYGIFNSSILNKNILARVSLQGSVFNVLSQNNLILITNPRQYFGPVNISRVQVQLLDEYGRILNLNNMDYSFCLTFQTVYDI
jgi:hypothetical protein